MTMPDHFNSSDWDPLNGASGDPIWALFMVPTTAPAEKQIS